MTVTNTWMTRLLRLVLGLLIVFNIFTATAALLLVNVVLPWIGGMTNTATAAALATSHGSGLSAATASWPSRVLFCLFIIERLCVGVIVFGLLSRMLRDASRGLAFSMANVSRLRIVALVYTVSLVSRFTLPFLAPLALRRWLASIQWSFNLSDLALLVVALVLAEVFREGLRLREEAALTV